jgi:hypothetical protein
VEEQEFKKILPAEYHENALILLIQSPKVLYAYWELSPGLKNTLSEKKKVQIRLNIEGNGIIQFYEIDLTEKSYYFENVQPGLSYNCEIGTVNADKIFIPLLRSNTITAPQDLHDSFSSGESNPSSSANLNSKVM